MAAVTTGASLDTAKPRCSSTLDEFAALVYNQVRQETVRCRGDDPEHDGNPNLELHVDQQRTCSTRALSSFLLWLRWLKASRRRPRRLRNAADEHEHGTSTCLGSWRMRRTWPQARGPMCDEPDSEVQCQSLPSGPLRSCSKRPTHLPCTWRSRLPCLCTLLSSITKWNVDIRKEFYTNVALAPSTPNFQVIAPPERKYPVQSCLSSLCTPCRAVWRAGVGSASVQRVEQSCDCP